MNFIHKIPFFFIDGFPKLVLIHNLSNEVRSEKISLFQRSARKGLGSMEPSVKPFHEEVKLAKSQNVSICFIQAALAK